MKAIGKFFATPSFARTLVIIAGIVLLFLGIFWYRSYRKRRQQEKQFEDDYDQLVEGANQQPTFLKTNYQQFADKIYEAGCSGIFCYGTDEDAIYDVFRKMKNDLDVLLLVKAFGLREPRGGICIPIPGTGECEIALGPWLQGELGDDEFAEINKILTQNAITYKF